MAVSNYTVKIGDWAFGPDAATFAEDAGLSSFAYSYGLGWGITEVDGLKTRPDVRSADTARPYAHGTYAGADRYDGRTITITMQLLNTWYATDVDFANALRALELATQVSDVPQMIQFKMPGWNHTTSGNQIVQVFGRIRGCAINMDVESYGLQAPVAQIMIYCNDPTIYSITTEVNEFVAPSGTGGRAYPMTFPVDYGGGSETTVLEVPNSGSVLSYPIVDFYGPCTNPFLNNETTGETFTLSAMISTGDFIRVDFRNQTVLFNGVTNQRNLVKYGSTFWGFTPITGISPEYDAFWTNVSYGFSSGSDPAEAIVTSYTGTWI